MEEVPTELGDIIGGGRGSQLRLRLAVMGGEIQSQCEWALGAAQHSLFGEGASKARVAHVGLGSFR